MDDGWWHYGVQPVIIPCLHIDSISTHPRHPVHISSLQYRTILLLACFCGPPWLLATHDMASGASAFVTIDIGVGHLESRAQKRPPSRSILAYLGTYSPPPIVSGGMC
ncbi:hypothetical protein VFPPC_15583 [Pochonia chlamydosporia 170]|uniref:Uncharacterized protein n=1 Tax=Pochonia chlamydosporia 170 TaxID=1380566 RepID=A0A179FZ08_METCM|nr:hypothetical protein VFPPC_15583 [Pochonia chlamydosporia 170]OAQ70468.1 hypothetical protein VFPPC_15583 [Pochonia chlamydosporia 170]